MAQSIEDSVDSKIFLGKFDRNRLLIAGYIKNEEFVHRNDHRPLSIPFDIHRVVFSFYILSTLRLIFCDENGDIDDSKVIERGITDGDLSLMSIFVTV